MMDWSPAQRLGPGPKYRAIVEALANDIASGRIGTGARLPPHRELAERLGLSVGTVTRAYAEAEERGLVSGEVGRGTFVLGPGSGTDPQGRRTVDLALNVPPATGAEELIAQVLAEIAADRGFGALMAYQPHQGGRGDREAIAQWMAAHGVPADADGVYVTQGGQHALSVALSLLARPADVVLVESLTYSGVVSQAAYGGQRLHGVAMDELGVIPDALRAALDETGARAVYLNPTLQTPTGSTLPDERRGEIADVLRRRDAFLVEDDAYGFLPERPVRPIASLIPERSFYIVSFAKCLVPGLRVGAMTIPAGFRDRVLNALRATGWMAAPPMAEALGRLLRRGEVARQVERKREAARRRVALAGRILGGRMRPQPLPSFHIWLELPVGRTVSALVREAAYAGVTLAGPAAVGPAGPGSSGIRFCLGAAPSEAELEGALKSVAAILDGADLASVV